MSYMVSDLRAQVSNGDLEDAVTATLSNSKAYRHQIHHFTRSFGNQSGFILSIKR